MIFALGALALAAIYVLHGGLLAKRWGVDPSRKTPAAWGLPGRKRAPGAIWAVLAGTAACLWPALWLYVYVFERHSTLAGALAVAGAAILGGVLAFAALFVCVRRGMDLAQAAGEELFPAATKAMYALGALAVLLFQGYTVRFALTDAAYDSVCTPVCALIWVLIAVMTASYRIAPSMCNERHMRPAAYGGAVYTGLLVLAAGFAAEYEGFDESPVMILLGIAAMVAFYVYPLCLAGDGVRGLVKSPLPKKKKAPDFLWTLLCAAAAALLGRYGGAWMLPASCAAGIAYLLLAVMTCTKWFYRIGRGFFARR